MYDIVNKWKSNTHTKSILTGSLKDITQYTYFPWYLCVGLNFQLQLITVVIGTIHKDPYYILLYNINFICIYYSCIYTYTENNSLFRFLFQCDTQKMLHENSNLFTYYPYCNCSVSLFGQCSNT